MAKLAPVKVGTGTKIHAAIVQEVQKGRHLVETYIHLCGSGDSSLGHSFRTASVKRDHYSKLEDINCKKCLESMEKMNDELA